MDYDKLLDKLEEIQVIAYSNNIGSNEEQLEVRTEIIKLLQQFNKEEQSSVPKSIEEMLPFKLEQGSVDVYTYLKDKGIHIDKKLDFLNAHTCEMDEIKVKELLQQFNKPTVRDKRKEALQPKEICTTIFDDGFMCSSCEGRCKHPVTVEWIEEKLLNKPTVREGDYMKERRKLRSFMKFMMKKDLFKYMMIDYEQPEMFLESIGMKPLKRTK